MFLIASVMFASVMPLVPCIVAVPVLRRLMPVPVLFRSRALTVIDEAALWSSVATMLRLVVENSAMPLNFSLVIDCSCLDSAENSVS